MLRDDQRFMHRVVLLAVLFIVLIVCLVIYGTRSNKFSEEQPSASYTPTLTNPEILQNWLPAVSYDYMVTRIDGYLQANNLLISTMTFESSPIIDESSGGSYNFSILLEPQNQTYKVSVSVDNLNGTISTGVSINGQSQGYSVPSQSNTGIRFSGINTLISDGITALQAEELQAAFQKFAPTASSISINTNTIILPRINPDNASLTNTYTFAVSFNNTNYSAKLNTIGLSQIELFLIKPSTDKQVFDSGVIGQS